MKAQAFTIEGATIVDGRGGRIADASVAVAAGQIRRVGPRDPASKDQGCVYAGEGLTVLPGLIDCHVHLLAQHGGGKDASSIWNAITFPEEQALHAAANALTALECGFTTVRDTAGSRAEVSVRNAIRDGVVRGPRIVASGFVGMTAGHGDLFFPPGLSNRQWKTADGPVECRKLVREYARMGVDLIKICTSGGVLSSGDETGWRNFTDEEVATIVDEAHALGMAVAAHAHSRSGIAQALTAGVDTLEHGTELDLPLIEQMVRQGTYLCATLTIGEFLAAHAAERGVPEKSIAKAERSHATQIQNVRLAYQTGVKMIAGTDSCLTMPFGRHAEELAYLVHLVGLTPMEAVVAATSEAAKALRIESATGSLAPGLDADLVVVEGDPLRDIALLQDPSKILGVIRGGELMVDRGLSGHLRRSA